MKLSDAPCCACGARTVLTVTFLGPLEHALLVLRVPCCDLCQSNMTEDVRALVLLAARERAGLRHQVH